MGQHAIVLPRAHGPLVLQTVLPLTQGVDPPSHRRNALATGEMEPFNTRGVHLPATCPADLRNGFQGAAAPPRFDGDEPPPLSLHALRLEQPGLGPPARLGQRSFGPATLGWHPLRQMRQQGRAVLLEAIGQKQRETAWRPQALAPLPHPWGLGLGAGTDGQHQPQLARGGHRRPYPVGRTLQALDGLRGPESAVFDGPQDGGHLVELPRASVHVTQPIAGKGLAWLGRCPQPPQPRVGGNRADASRGASAEALRQARQPTHDQLHGDPSAMKNRAMGLENIAFAGETLELTPRATAGRAVRAQVA